MTSVKVTLRHEDDEHLETMVLNLGRRYGNVNPDDIDDTEICVALDYLGFENPEPWTLVSIEEN